MAAPNPPYTPSFELPTFFNTVNLGTLFGNTGELLTFVMPILLLFLAIKFAGQFIQVLKGAIRSFVKIMGSGSSSSSSRDYGYDDDDDDDRKYGKYKNTYKDKGYKVRGRR